MSTYELFFDDDANKDAGAAVTGSTTYYSTRLNCQGASRASLHAIWTGTPTGTFTIQSTNLDTASTSADTGWIDETVTMPANPAGSASATLQHLYENAATWVRLKYVNTSGSGTLRCLAVTKE